MRRRAVLLSVAAIGLSGCSRSMDPQIHDFGRRVQATPRVVRLDKSTNPWRVEVDTSLPSSELQYLGMTLHGLAEEVGQSLDVVHGQVRAHISSSPVKPPHLGWMRWLEGRPDMEQAMVRGKHAYVKLTSPETVAWVLSLLDEAGLDDSWVSLEVRSGASCVNVLTGEDETIQNFRLLASVFGTSSATVTRLTVAPSWSRTQVEVESGDDAVALVRALHEQRFPDPDWTDLTIRIRDGRVLKGSLPDLAYKLVTGGQTVRAIYLAGAQVARRGKDWLRVSVPNAEVAKVVVVLIQDPTWKPGDDFVLQLGLGEYTSILPLPQWRKLGPLWADAVASGLPRTEFYRHREKSRPDRQFAVIFGRHVDGPDLTTPDGNQRIIDVMRRHPFDGEAQIVLSANDDLTFWSTSTGRALEPYSGAKLGEQNKPHGWQLDFLRRWDASATE